jgi:hypothetical protein
VRVFASEEKALQLSKGQRIEYTGTILQVLDATGNLSLEVAGDAVSPR